MKNNLYAYGVMSRTYDDSHIYMGDIDGKVTLKSVNELCTKIIKHFLLSDIYIIQSSNGFNFYSLDKLPLKMVCLLYTSPSPRDRQRSRMPSSA